MNTLIYQMTNSGLFFYAKDTGILIDGLYGSGPYQCFSDFPVKLHKQMVENEGIFKLAKAAIFTHAHEDHLDWDRLRHMCAIRNDLGVYVYGGPQNTLNAETIGEGIKKIQLPPFEIIMIDTLHEGTHENETSDIKHCMILLKIEEEEILLTGDSVLGEREVKILGQFGKVQVVFCNPLQLALEKKCQFFRDISPERIFITHLPEEKDDRFSYRKLAEQECARVDINGIHPEIPKQLEWIDGKNIKN